MDTIFYFNQDNTKLLNIKQFNVDESNYPSNWANLVIFDNSIMETFFTIKDSNGSYSIEMPAKVER